MQRVRMRGIQGVGVLLCGLALACCADDGTGAAPGYDVVVSDPAWIVPSDALPDRSDARTFNDELSLVASGDRLYFAWRAAPSPFATADARLQVISSPDLGVTWDYETTFHAGADLRAPLLYEAQGTVFVSFVGAGTDPLDYEPQAAWRSHREGPEDWSYPQRWGEPGEVPWAVARRAGRLHLTSYLGVNPMGGVPGEVDVRLHTSRDGETWWPASKKGAVVHHGGASEAAIEFGPEGDLWALLRNEEGDDTGFGSLLCRAPTDRPAAWDCPGVSDPERYDAPRMFRHDDEIYLVARRDLDGPYAQADPEATFAEQQLTNVLAYQARPKRTAVFHVDREARALVHLLDLPSAGDTGFPSVVQLDEHTFVVANYTSPLESSELSWIDGQMSEDGTQIYLVTLTFVPAS